jgi:hypothetical protein
MLSQNLIFERFLSIGLCTDVFLTITSHMLCLLPAHRVSAGTPLTEIYTFPWYHFRLTCTFGLFGPEPPCT